MSGFWRVFRFEFTRQFGRRGYQFATFGIPILMIVALFVLRAASATPSDGSDVAPSRQNTPPEIAEDSPLGRARPSGYVDLGGLLQTPVGGFIVFQDVESAREALNAGEIGAYYVISPDYKETGKVEAYFESFNLGNLTNAQLRAALVGALAADAKTDEEKALVALLQSREVGIQSFVTTAIPGAAGLAGGASAFSEGAAFILITLFSMLLLISSFLTSGYLMQSLVEEKENRTVEVLISSVRPRDLLFGKFVALSLAGLVQMGLWLAVVIWGLGQVVDFGPAFSGFRITLDQIVGLSIYFMLGYLLFGAAFAVIGAVATNMREGPQFAAFITIPVMIPFWALNQFVAQPNSDFATALSMFPITAPLAMVMRISVTTVPAGQIILSAGVLALTVIGLIWLAARLFRVSVLLAGNMPKLRDIVRLVREKA